MKRKIFVAAFALLLAITISYANHFNTGLHPEDYPTIRDNSTIRSLKNIPRFFFDPATSATDPSGYAYRPLVTTSFAIDYFLSKGTAPLLFHLSTYLTFLAGLVLIAWMFFIVFEQIYPHPWNAYLAIMGTALFALHPAVAELLNPLTQRGELYAALGVVGGVAMYGGLPAQRRFGLYLLPPFLGVLANPAGLVFGPMLLAYIFLIEAPPDETEPLSPEQTKTRDQSPTTEKPTAPGAGPHRIRIRRRKHPFRRYMKAQLKRFMPALLFTGIAGTLHAFVTPFDTSGEAVTSYWFTQPWVAWRYFRSFFAPTHLGPSSDLAVFKTYDIHAVLGLAFVITLISVALIVVVSRQWRPAIFGIWWFILGVLPGALLMQSDVEKDTRMFLPFIGLALTLTWAGRMLLPSGEPLRRLEAIVAIGVMLTLAYGTYTRNRVWSDEETLWRDNIEKHPASVLGLQNYGLALAARGRMSEAYDYLRKARQLQPESGEIEANLGTVAAALNLSDEADERFRHARALSASRPFGHFAYGAWLEQQLVKRAWRDPIEEIRKRSVAIDAYSWASSLAPSDLRPRYGMMRIYRAAGDWNNLRKVVEEVQALAPSDPDIVPFAESVRNHPDPVKGAEQLARDHPTPENYVSLSDAYWLAGEPAKCLEAAQKALALRPDYAIAYNYIGAAYLAQGRLDEAIVSVKTALRIDPDDKLAKSNLLEWERQQRVVGNTIMRK